MKRNLQISFYANENEQRILKLAATLGFQNLSVFVRQNILNIAQNKILDSRIPLDELLQKYHLPIDLLWNRIIQNKKQEVEPN